MRHCFGSSRDRTISASFISNLNSGVLLYHNTQFVTDSEKFVEYGCGFQCLYRKSHAPSPTSSGLEGTSPSIITSPPSHKIQLPNCCFTFGKRVSKVANSSAVRMATRGE